MGLNAITRRLRLMVDRAIVRMVSDSLERQNLQIQTLADTTDDDVERFQNYGFTSVPPEGSEAIVLAVGGRRDGLVAIAVEDKRCRPKGLSPGDVRLYHQDGKSHITLKKGGIIEITGEQLNLSGKTVNLTADELLNIIGKQMKFVGPCEFTEDATINGKSFIKHIHKDGEVTVIVQAEEAGVAGNLAAGSVLTLLSPLPGTGSTGAVVNSGITGGADIESIAELLDRLLYVRRNPPVGGALHDYVIWAREVPGVSRAWAWDVWHGPGTVGLAWLYDDREDIVPTREDLKTMEQYLFCHKHPATGVMVGKPGGIEVWPVQVRLKKLDLSIRLTPDSQANRNAVRANLTALQKTLAPGQMLPVSSLRTAIGMTSGITDYFLNIGEDTTSDVDELITIGEVTWLTA
ncbi:phage baseplate assembly protein V [Escherichia coli]|uniref:phage baseplate assembly protein V n=1 Tax=Escherichia coli TaxID=562 RepID=UPI003D2445C2